MQEPDPVFIFEHATLYPMEGDDTDDSPMEIGRAIVRRTGQDVTLVTYGGSLYKTLRAAEALAEGGDRSRGDRSPQLGPLDIETVLGRCRRPTVQ